MPRLTVKTQPYRESLLESLKNPDEAVPYLNACLEDEDAHVFLLALRDVAKPTAASESCRVLPTRIGRASIECSPSPAIHLWIACPRS
jgi:hypothetical protein